MRGPIHFGEARVEQRYLTSSNGPVRVFGINGASESSSSPKVEVKTLNAPVTLSRVSEVSKLSVKTSNAKITTDNGEIVASRICGYVALALVTSNEKYSCFDVNSRVAVETEAKSRDVTSNSACGVEETGDLSKKKDTETVNLQNLTVGSALTVAPNSGSVKAGSSDNPIQFGASIGKAKRSMDVKVSDPSSYTGSFDIRTSNDEHNEVSSVGGNITMLKFSPSKKIRYKGSSNSVQSGR
ncbi:hypothetical protein BJ742DRAFT_774306 [Cladochytrium replicatum]|nr:hypothetical protein BJ742DRAFT_774306 [Cladochytrium replicatum]